MPKAKKHKPQDGPPAKKSRKMHAFSKLSTSSSMGKPGPNNNGSSNVPAGKKAQQQQQKRRKPVVPFARRDRVLLVGEGDFSFARSLVTQHKCRHLLATCYDGRATLCEKYPQAEANINTILNAGHHQRPDENPSELPPRQADPSRSASAPRVLYSIDARKLGATGGGGKEVRGGFPRRRRAGWKQQPQQQMVSEHGPWDVICFNFPHVGGLSTDVNRQVRYNQELLVGFFKACVPLLSVPGLEEEDEEEDEEDEEGYGFESESDAEAGSARRTEPGQILVTLFEGEPYTLWNIRDLARHAGLRVVTSFRFPWASYEGYSHARTLGEVEGKHGGRGGWRGEDREARMYVFENAQVQSAKPGNGKRKKKRGNDSDSDSD